MDTASFVLQAVAVGVTLLCGVLFFDRRITRLENLPRKMERIEEKLNWLYFERRGENPRNVRNPFIEVDD